MHTPRPGPSSNDLLAGRYRLGALLGSGGMGAVFEAHDQLLQRRVAIKRLPPELETDPLARERLRREALAAAALDHPYICKIYEIGEADGGLFIVMEYVEGETLHTLAGRSMLPLRQVVELATEIVEALEEAHRRGVVHRDLKPANLMLTKQGHVKVMDFGLAKQQPKAPADNSTTPTTLTDAGTRLGTPAYMSPEQVLGAALDARSDIFSLGVILHELAAGRHPFLRADPSETMAAILRDPPAAGSRDLDSLSGLGGAVTKMLAKACAERPQTMGELRVAFEGLRRRVRVTEDADSTNEIPESSVERTRFVGREAETTELWRLLDRMLTGHGGIALVGGEPGVGKTRLAEELLREATERGCFCVVGHCYEQEGAPPFVSFVEVLEETVRRVPHGARAAMAEEAAEIASIGPSLRRTYADIPPMPEVPAEQRRRLVFTAFLAYLRRATEKSPSVVLLDDLHWADEPTLQLLLHMAPQLASMRLLVLGTYRDVELDVRRPFAKTLEALLRQRHATRIPLRRLDEAAVQQLLSALGGSVPPSGLSHIVFRETEGNPFFVEEVFQHLAEEGKLFDAGGAWKADLRVGAIEVPEGVRLVVGRRLERLGERALKVLTAAAVIGRTFPLDLVQAVVDVSEDEVLEALDEAERAQLVATEAGRRSVRYGFGHELIRTTLVGGLSLPRRQRLHLRIADALERQPASSPERKASVLAHHLYQAGAAADTQRTAGALAAAGRAALAAGAFEDALDQFDHLAGLELAAEDPFLAEALEHRGDALTGLQRLDEAVAAFDRAQALYTARRDDAGIERSARRAGGLLIWRIQLPASMARLIRGLEALSDEAVRERARLLAGLASVQVLSLQFDDAWESVQSALAIAEDLGDGGLLGLVLFNKAICHRFSGEYQPALELFRRARVLVHDGALWERSQVLTHLVWNNLEVGRLADSEALLPELEACSARAGNHLGLFNWAVCGSIITLARTGDLRAWMSPPEQVGRSGVLPGAMSNFLGVGRLYLGDVGKADEAMRAYAEAVADQNSSFKGLPEANLFGAAALAGDNARARALALTVEPWLPVCGRRNAMAAFLTLEGLVSGLAFLGDLEACGRLYPLLLEDIQTGLVLNAFSLGPVNPQLGAALAADAAGLADRAQEHFEIALGQARDVPIRLLQPTVLYWYGRALARNEHEADRARGRGMVQAALEDFRSLEMVLHAQLAEDWLRASTTERA